MRNRFRAWYTITRVSVLSLCLAGMVIESLADQATLLTITLPYSKDAFGALLESYSEINSCACARSAWSAMKRST